MAKCKFAVYVNERNHLGFSFTYTVGEARHDVIMHYAMCQWCDELCVPHPESFR